MADGSAYRGFGHNDEDMPLGSDCSAILDYIESGMGGSADMILDRRSVNGVKIGLLMFDGLLSNQQVSETLLRALSEIPAELDSPDRIFGWLRSKMFVSSEQGTASTYRDLFIKTMSGFAAVMIDGCEEALTFGYTSFATRGVSEPSAEVNMRGSREGFSESLNQNTALVRRRLKSNYLVAETAILGEVSRTQARIFYIRGVAPQELVDSVRSKLSEIKVGALLDTGYIQPFLEGGRLSLFSGVGVTERPDTLCAKLIEGRIAILVDGSPFAIVVPYLFIEHFQSLDDYTHRPFFATFVRAVKFLAFFLTILLPGTYVAVLSFHAELIPPVLLGQFISSVEYTPLPVLAEALLVFVLYELLREAGLRLPRPIGHAMGIVGGIVIGDAAVQAGLLGLPMIIVIALTAITSFVVPSLYEPVTLLRFGFMIIGGAFGLYGVFLAFALMIVDICSLSSMGVPVTVPLSPTVPRGLRDVLVRAGWRRLQEPTFSVDKTPGKEPADGE